MSDGGYVIPTDLGPMGPHNERVTVRAGFDGGRGRTEYEEDGRAGEAVYLHQDQQGSGCITIMLSEVPRLIAELRKLLPAVDRIATIETDT